MDPFKCLFCSDVLKCRFPVNFGRLKGPHNAWDHAWSFDGRRFFARFQQVFPTWFAWIYILGGDKDASDYKCRITAHGPNSRITFEGPVHPIDTPKKEVRNRSGRGLCLQLTDETIDAFKTSEGLRDADKVRGFNNIVKVDFQVIKVHSNGIVANGFH